ncbi:MAG: hypothetical protein K2X27_25780 [Candidatus Obscuribacterales bacterium]|nr:hypothetical protein [Candidatus Obscuribacterales bacterium]
MTVGKQSELSRVLIGLSLAMLSYMCFLYLMQPTEVSSAFQELGSSMLKFISLGWLPPKFDPVGMVFTMGLVFLSNYWVENPPRTSS